MKKAITIETLSLFLDKVKGIIPSKLSELTNDSNYVQDANYVHTDNNYSTQDKQKLDGIDAGANNYELPKATSSTLGGIMIGDNITIDSGGKISVSAMDWANINGKPTKLSEFTNDTNFITKTVSDLTNYYNKDNTYTKAEVNSIIGDLKTIEITKVEALPETGERNIIYLVPRPGALAPDLHDEYIWDATSNRFEKIGSTQIDLSGYWSKEELIEATIEDINGLFES